MTDLTEILEGVEVILAAARVELADVAERRAALADRESRLRRAVAGFEEALALLRDEPVPEPEPGPSSALPLLRCPIEGCGPRPRNRQGLMIHLTNGHRDRDGRYLARPYRGELLKHAARVAAGEERPPVRLASLVGPAPGTIPLAISELTEEEKADNTTDDHCTGCLSECTCDDEPADPAVVPLFGCPARSDDGRGMCDYSAADPDELYEHLESHKAWSGRAAEDIDARCEAVRDAQRAAGVPATYGTEPVR